MISYKKLKKIHEEIKKEHKEIEKHTKKQVKLLKENIANNEEYSQFCKKYVNLFNRIIDINYKVSLNKIIPAIMKVHKNSNTKSNLLKKNFPLLLEELKTKKIDTLQLLKTIRDIKLKYEKQLTINNQYNLDSYEKIITNYSEKYPEFKQNNPVLFEGMIKKTLDRKTLEKMFEMYKLFYEKKLSNHDASVQFGTLLVDKFIKPHLKK